MIFRSLFIGLIFVTLVSGCASKYSVAPVVERTPPVAKKSPPKVYKEGDWRPQIYAVQKGDTLYGIALEHGFDYKEIAEWNNIVSPYTIRVGQQLKFNAAAPPGAVPPLKVVAEVKVKPVVDDPFLKTQPKVIKQLYSEQLALPNVDTHDKPAQFDEKVAVVEKKEDVQANDDEKIEWSWPTSGKVISPFNEASSSGKGLDIGGNSGQPVLAAASGKVVYSGGGLRGYGKLVIVKHSKTYLSAYAHNRQILVKEGQAVIKGQKIAEMGNSDADQVKLHFEIRQLGKPVDPMKFLPKTTS